MVAVEAIADVEGSKRGAVCGKVIVLRDGHARFKDETKYALSQVGINIALAGEDKDGLCSLEAAGYRERTIEQLVMTRVRGQRKKIAHRDY